jgi:cytochrome P450/nitrite reductase/ring-hydroxylating ferredoxin subunit
MMAKVRVANVADVDEGGTLRVDAAGRPLLLSRFDGQFFAIEAVCSHAGGRLEDGDFRSCCVVCPIHSAVFDLTTGKVQPETNWASDLESFHVTAEGESLFVEIGSETEKPTGVQSTARSESAACPFSAADAGIDFDPMSADQRECPFDLYRKAREQMPVFYSERFDLWVVTRYDDVVRILKDPTTFSSAESLSVDPIVAPEVQAVLDTGFPATPTLVTADPPVHTRFRELIGKAFTSRRVAQLEPQMFDIANRLVDVFVQRGSADIVRQFAYPFPMEVIAEILGLPISDMDRFKRWSDDMSARFGLLPLDRQIECARSEVEFQHYFAARLEERRHSPQQDFLTDLLNARIHGERPLDMLELLSILKQLLIGGNETSTNMISSAMLLLMTNAEQLEVVVNDRTKIADVVEEVLRLD